MAIDVRVNISLIAALVLREKRNQQNYRSIIAVHKWRQNVEQLIACTRLAEFRTR